MKTITTNNRTLLFVEVPEDAKMFAMTPNGNLRFVASESHKFKSVKIDNVRAKFIATTDTISLVGKVKILGGKDPNHDWDRYFQSFLNAHSITGRHAIIEVL